MSTSQPEGQHPARTRTTRRTFLLGVGAAASAAALLLAGCGGDEDEPTTTPTATSTADGSATATESPTGTATETSTSTAEASPTLDPDGSDSETPDDGAEATPEDAVSVLDQYFSAIGLRDFETAYSLWRNDGEASGQTYEEFVEGYADTASISWEIGEPGRIDAGAGQRYIEIPVRITARLSSGDAQVFEGTYVLHHTANIDGATPEQLLWRLHSADVTEVEE